jgi:hypothetical protein
MLGRFMFLSIYLPHWWTATAHCTYHGSWTTETSLVIWEHFVGAKMPLHGFGNHKSTKVMYDQLPFMKSDSCDCDGLWPSKYHSL